MKFLIKFFAVVISLFQINFTAAQSSSCTWGATFGGLSGALGTKHILDNSGNSILFGGFAGKIYLDPKKNSTFLQSTMGSDFLIKLNKKGTKAVKKEYFLVKTILYILLQNILKIIIMIQVLQEIFLVKMVFLS
jgi:hypothetical protein